MFCSQETAEIRPLKNLNDLAFSSQLKTGTISFDSKKYINSYSLPLKSDRNESLSSISVIFMCRQICRKIIWKLMGFFLVLANVCETYWERWPSLARQGPFEALQEVT